MQMEIRQMMKLVVNTRRLISIGESLCTRFLGLCTAVEADVGAGASAAVAPKGGNGERLYRRLSALGGTKGRVASTLNEYIREGRVARKDELNGCVKQLRRYQRHEHALEIIEWMEHRNIKLSFRDYAIKLDLLSKVRGIVAAENYFSTLPPSARNFFTYGSLLNCYCKEKMEDKALALFEKMVDMRMASTLAFNNLMALYMRLGQPEKVPSLVQSMKQGNTPLDTFTYSIWMQSISCSNDIEGVEEVFETMKREDKKHCDWSTYTNLAAIYVKAGLREKADLALQMAEQLMGPHNQEAYHFLLTLYAGNSNLNEVHRVWNSLKSSLRITTNLSYLTMLQALENLDDVDGLIKCFEEWELNCSSYDMRLANTAIGAFLKHEMITEAKSTFQRAIARSAGPFSIAWELFAYFYLERHQTGSALKCVEAAVSEVEGKVWHPISKTVGKFMKHFAEEKDVDGAEAFFKILKKGNCLDSIAYEYLLQTYSCAGKTAPDLCQRMQEDGIEVSSEFEGLLKRVCPEHI